MKTKLIKPTTLALAATFALAAAAPANPGDNKPFAPIPLLAPARLVPEPGASRIAIPVQFARFGAFPHPGAAFAPYYVNGPERIGSPLVYRPANTR